ncbi:MAG: GIY-YIG nuclease family protein [Synergistaceae bacterium]|nr:GIY-YIG nuclease family protein [Synergistaceae bacterium]
MFTILTNPTIPYYVKIGYADNVEERVKTLNSNPGLPFSFRVYATYRFAETDLFHV